MLFWTLPEGGVALLDEEAAQAVARGGGGGGGGGWGPFAAVLLGAKAVHLLVPAGLSGGRYPKPLRSRAPRGAGRRGPRTRGSQSPSPAKALPSPARGRPGPAPPRSGSFGSRPASPLSPFLPARVPGVVSHGLQGPAGNLPEAPSAGGPEPSPFGGDVQEGVPGSSFSPKTPGPGCQRVLRAPAGSSLISDAEQTRRRAAAPGWRGLPARRPALNPRRPVPC
ncbi:unnamed protein product [Rangifer tarandus platyrhynchus]|uniref:Uncharacterized protein n=1 Tax=Rangifer tarandus platyrhynchus TaxID=3082113 RepID=A0ABN8Z4U8_RANTA|nr:unnamed protein product [Rangifer tarandus platyrhynchus]